MSTFWIVTFWVAAAAQFYILAGYSLLLLLASILVRRKGRAEFEPTVSVVIPAYNEAKNLREKLENTLSLDYPAENLEVLVASDGSTDSTIEIARAFEQRGVKVLANPRRRGKTAALNRAVGRASGEVLCLCDANVIFEPDALKVLVARLADPNVGAVTGDVRLASHESNFGHGENLYYRIERRLQLAESRVGSLMGVDGGMYALRKALFRAPPPDTILDDFVISMGVMRQGYRVVYEPGAVAHENGTPSARHEWHRRVRVAAGAVQSLKRGDWPPITRPVELWQYVSHKALRWMSPVLLLLLLAANVALLPVAVFYQITLAVQLAVYLLAALGLVSVRFRKTPLGGIPFYFVMSNAAMVVGLFKGLFNLQPVTWVRAERTRTRRKEQVLPPD